VIRSRLALVALVLAAAGTTLAGCGVLPHGGDAPRDPSGTPTASNGNASAFSIKVGDCLDDADIQGKTTTAPIVPCSDPHDSEAYAAFTLKDGDYPGDDAVQADADAGCSGTAFANFVGIASSDSTLQYSYYFPTQDSWAGGDREIMCTVYAVDDAGKPVKVTGTLKDSAR
jgi:hypothetical protein